MPRTPADPTVVTPRPAGTPPGRPPRADATAMLPPVDDWAAGRGNPAWSGRAEVRAPQPGGPEYQEPDWPAGPVREPRDRWWMPILLGIVGLVLAGALGWGIYLIAQHSGTDETPAPTTTTTSAAPQPSATTATTEPSSQPTTTSPPTTTPSTTEPTAQAITIPALVGLSLPNAQAALNQRGLNYRLLYRPADNVPADTVIDSDPKEGQEVPPDTTITLVIAAAQQTTTPSSPSTATPDEPNQDDVD
ncbi:PASTA domain-containing protein [Micromonosporaceae bacterium Da 78-11]